MGITKIASSGSTPAQAFDPTLTTSVFDDLSWGNEVSNSPNGPFGLVPTGNFGGGIFTSANVTAPLLNRWGVIGMGVGTNANANGNGEIFSDYAICYPGQAQTTTLQFSVYTPSNLADATNDYVMELGFRDSPFTSARAANAMAIAYSRTISTNWMGYTANASTSTNVTTANGALAVTANAWWNFKIVITSSSVSFYAATPGNAFTLIGTSTTNLPTSSAPPFMCFTIYKVASFALQRLYAIDYVKLDMTFNSTR